MIPVVILTARSSIDDKVQGLDMGADDYLAKPFEPAELFARLRVASRRVNQAQSSLLQCLSHKLAKARANLYNKN